MTPFKDQQTIQKGGLPSGGGEFASGWRLVAACFIGMGTGILAIPYATAGLFIAPLSAEFGWSRLDLSVGPTLLLLLVATTSPLVGSLADRLKPVSLLSPSMLMVAACYFLASRLGPYLAVYYALIAAMAVVGSGTSALLFSRIINGHFVRHRGLALGVALSGNGVTMLATPMLLTPYIATHGWRAGYLCLAGLLTAAASLIWLLLPRDLEPSRSHVPSGPGVPTGMVIRSPLFWRITGALLVALLGTSGMLIHFVPFLTDAGFPPTRAGAVASLIGVGLLAGRLSSGWLMDRFFAPLIGALVLGVAGVGFLATALLGADAAAFGALSIGLVIGFELDMMGYLTVRYFGLVAFGRIYGVLYGAVLVGTALSPALYGALLALTGHYTAAFWVGTASLALAAYMLAGLPPFPKADCAPMPIGDIYPDS